MARQRPDRFRHARMGAALVVSASLFLSACGESEGAADGTGAGKAVGATPTVHTPTGEKSASSKPTKTKTKTQELKSTSKPSGASNNGVEPGEPLPFPDAAKENTAEGAEAYVKWLYGSLSNILLSPRAGAGKVLNPNECSACSSFEEIVDEDARLGRRYDAPPLSVESAAAETFDQGATWAVELQMTQNPVSLVGRGGEVESVAPRETLRYLVELEHNGEHLVPLKIYKRGE